MNNIVPVFVVGACHHNTLGVIRGLGFNGINPNVIIVRHNKNPYIGYSKYIERKWIVDNNEEVINVLFEEGRSLRNKAVLIACSDSLSSLVDENSQKLSEYYYIPGASGTLTPIMNKSTMSLLAERIGFTVPKFVSTTSDAEVPNLPLPWIIKPLVSKNGQKTDIQRIYTEEEWEEYKKAGHTHEIQVQKLIKKDYEYQLIGVSLKSGEDVIIPGVSVVLRPAINTNTGFLRYEPLDDSYTEVLILCKKFLKEVGYSGLFSMEFLRGIDGKDYFMEINFRNDGNAICVTASGVNLPYIWYLYNTGQDYRDYLSTTHVRPVYVMPEMSDLSYIKQGKLSVLSWIKDICKTDCFMEFSKKDPMPFVHLIVQKIKTIF